MGLFGKGLTLSHTVAPFHMSGIEVISKHCGKRRTFSPFHTMFSILSDRNCHSFYIYFVVCKCFPFVQGQIFVGWEWVKFVKWQMINPFPNKPWFLSVCRTRLLKTLWEKEKLLVTSNFSFSNSIFHPFGEYSAIFIKLEIVVCKVFEFCRV